MHHSGLQKSYTKRKIILSIVYAEFPIKDRYAEYRYAKGRFSECRGAIIIFV